MHKRLKEARKNLKLSQEFVARQMCLSRPTISAIESGQRKATADELAEFSKLYGVSTDELMYGKVLRMHRWRCLSVRSWNCPIWTGRKS